MTPPEVAEPLTREEILQYDAKDADLLFDIKGRIEEAVEAAVQKRHTG